MATSASTAERTLKGKIEAEFAVRAEEGAEVEVEAVELVMRIGRVATVVAPTLFSSFPWCGHHIQAATCREVGTQGKDHAAMGECNRG